MTKKITMISLLMLLLCSGYLSAQWAGKPVRFAAETTYFPGNFEQIISGAAITGPEDVVEGRFVRFIQTETILNADQRSRAEALGVRFHGYVQFGAYLTSFPAGFDFSLLQTLPIRSVVPVKTAWKMAQNLKDRPFGEWAKRGDQIEIYLQVYPHVSVAKGAELCRRYGLDVLQQGRMNGILRVLISPDNLENIAALPFVRSMELISPPAEKEDTRGRSLLRSNMLDGDHSASLKFNGDGVKTLVRDDGRLGPHIDFQGRLHNMADGDEFAGTHGDGVGGIIGGAGNLDPYMKGMAAGADVYTLDYVDNFQDETMDLFFNENVTLTNSSYSNGCNTGYTTITQTVDQQLFDNPTLMHVFSAGNANSSDCGYGAGTQFGNITGGHKAAKNSIATANLKQDGTIDTTSSRGPVHDGRLKPDISANGNGHYSTDPDNGYQEFGGTSGAAPCIAGILAQLTQAYKSYNNGEEPRTDLLKAAIMNSANDIGPVGPDWRFGYGHINAHRAHNLLKQKRYAFAQIDQGATNTQTLNVPNNTRAVKVMIYWAEPAADVSTNRALINDLDLTITSAAGVVHMPWKLDPTPDPVILNMQAGRGRDSLNNCEQVVIEMPASGAYTIRVSGTEVPLGPQSYVLVWELVEPGPTLTYPNGGEGLVPGETARIHWDAYGADGNFTLRYSVDGGNTFQNITNITNAKQRMHDWTVPNTTSGQVRLMVIRNNRRDTSDQNLSIVRVPQNVHVLKVCPDSMTVAWNEVLDTLSYDVYVLGQKYMEIQGRSDTTWLTFPINDASVERWISVRAAHENGMTGRRAIAIKSPGYIKNCPQPEDLNLAALIAPSGDAIISCSATEQDITVKLRNDGLNPANGININYQANGGAVVSEVLPDMASGDSIEYTFITPLSLTQGSVVDLLVWATFPADDVTYNDTIGLSFPTIVGS
ncbi:MAG: S8 family serine peptidase, partial [Saprospiraceae bacterium]|nr:S8 family serine peptidase [Saprospiraceae bacterium]